MHTDAHGSELHKVALSSRKALVIHPSKGQGMNLGGGRYITFGGGYWRNCAYFSKALRGGRLLYGD